MNFLAACVHRPTSWAEEAGWVGVHPSSEQHLILIWNQFASAQLKRQTDPSTSAPAPSGTVAAVPGRGASLAFQSRDRGILK